MEIGWWERSSFDDAITLRTANPRNPIFKRRFSPLFQSSDEAEVEIRIPAPINPINEAQPTPPSLHACSAFPIPAAVWAEGEGLHNLFFGSLHELEIALWLTRLDRARLNFGCSIRNQRMERMPDIADIA
jgi:hypothetical protein